MMTPANDESKMVKSRVDVRRAVVSTSQFPNRTSLDAVSKHLRSIKATGQLVINFSQGGINSVTFEAQHKLNGHDHVELIFDSPEK